MAAYLVGVIIIIFVTLGWMYTRVGVPRVSRETLPEIVEPHRYRDPRQAIADIGIAAFYFVPKNKASLAVQNWNELLARNLELLKEFHTLQFYGRSRLTYGVYPEPIIGLKENLAYDTEVTQFGNPAALRRVAAELEERVFNPEGDKYRADFARGGAGAYRVIFILYEGVGASGSDNVALLSRRFLTDPAYRETGVTFLAHEFYHTLGIPDGYEGEKAIPTTADIMGLGRLKPIEKSYLSKETLKELGL